MNKKLIAVAVAGLFAAPAVAFAQSSVTISGYLRGNFENLKYSNSAKNTSSHSGVTDDSSQIQFNVVEDLGSGLQALAQMNMRFTIDQGAAISSGGNTHVGLRSKQWGRIIMGRQDLHYFNTESDMTTRGPLRSSSISLLAYVSPFGGGASKAIANATRTPNVVHYLSPNWGGFTMIAAYSSAPNTGAENDIGSGIRRGRAFNLNPNYQARNFQIGYSYWGSRDDAGTNTVAGGNQRGDRLYGSYNWGGFKFGLAWDKSKINGATSGGALSDRTAWSIPASYSWGNHSIHVHYDKARDDKATTGVACGTRCDDSAKMWAISYAYDLSKRTSAAVTVARISNAPGASYNLFTSSSLGLGINSAGTISAGEDPTMWALTLRHVF